jgi:hypothetical protein
MQLTRAALRSSPLCHHVSQIVTTLERKNAIGVLKASPGLRLPFLSYCFLLSYYICGIAVDQQPAKAVVEPAVCEAASLLPLLR